MAKRKRKAEQDAEEARLSDPARIPEVLAIEDPRVFFKEFRFFRPPFDDLKLPDYPPYFRKYQLLMYLDVNEELEDVGRFFIEWDQPVGAHVDELLGFLEEIGARPAAAYLREATALYPDGRVPKDEDERDRATRAIRGRAASLDDDPFRLLKKKHAGAIESVFAPYQHWVREHLNEHLAEMSAGKDPTRGTRSMAALNEMLALHTPPERVKGGAPKEHKALYTIWERISSRMHGRNPEKNLTSGERLLHIVFFVMDAEISNGGIHQFFSNSSGDFAEEAMQHLKTLGATATLNVLKQAASVFPGGTVPPKRATRNKVLDALPESDEARFDAWDKEYYRSRSEIYPLLHAYISSHKDQFADSE